jgi:hypothetical protein
MIFPGRRSADCGILNSRKETVAYVRHKVSEIWRAVIPDPQHTGEEMCAFVQYQNEERQAMPSVRSDIILVSCQSCVV